MHDKLAIISKTTKQCSSCYTTDIPIAKGRRHCILCERERLRLNSARWRESNPTKAYESCKRYRLSHTKQRSLYMKKWYKLHPDKALYYRHVQKLKIK